MTESKAFTDREWLVCEVLRKFGYYRSARTIRWYGEELHLISDPEPHEDRCAVRGIALQPSIVKHVDIPLSIVTMVEPEIGTRERSRCRCLTKWV